MAFPPKQSPAAKATKHKFKTLLILRKAKTIHPRGMLLQIPVQTPEVLMAKLLRTMQAFLQQQSSGQSELNAKLKTMGESLTFLNEAMSTDDLNVSLDNTDEMSESEISQEVEDVSDNIDQLLAETPQNEYKSQTDKAAGKGKPHKTTE